MYNILIMNEQELRQTVAENITFYRKRAGLTQSALAERLNYSDKSISKWERAEGMPDVAVLVEMSVIFGISLNDFITKDHSESDASAGQGEPHGNAFTLKRKFITVLSTGLVWLVASVLHFGISFIPIANEDLWLAYVVAVPVSFIVLTVFASIWGGCLFRGICVSGIIWGTALSVILIFTRFAPMYLILVIAAILQILTVIWFIMKSKAK